MNRNLLFRLLPLLVIGFIFFYFWSCLECCLFSERRIPPLSECKGYKEIYVLSLDSAKQIKVKDYIEQIFNIKEKDNSDSENTSISRYLTKAYLNSLKQESFDTVTIQVPFVCNQLIFTPSVADSNGSQQNADEMRRYLRCQGFKLDRTCACSDSLELWTYQGDDFADLIGVVKDPPKDNDGHTIGGLSLNYEVGIDNFEIAEFNSRDSVSVSKYKIDIRNQPPIDPNRSKEPDIIIGVSDSGIDLDSDPASTDLTIPDPANPFISYHYLWEKPNNLIDSCIIPGKYGLSKLTPYEEPKDSVGHGTFVNGILMGAAVNNRIPQQPVDVDFRLLNIKNSNSASFSVFDAVCGLFWGVKHGIKTFNVSWGFMDTTAGVPEILNVFLRTSDNDVILIAGTGNNGVSLDFNARFWPASLAETTPRVISVGALNELGTNRANFSNYSLLDDRMNVLAPGENIISLIPKSLQQNSANPTGYAIGSGTSYAGPYVTRAIAVLRAQTNPPPDILKLSLKTPAAERVTGIPVLGL